MGEEGALVGIEERKIAVIGLGYVGLPLAVEFGKKYETVGFDIDDTRIEQLGNHIDRTGELTKSQLMLSERLSFTSNETDLFDYDVFIITVPTPVTQTKEPDLNPLISASSLVGKYIKNGSIVIYESTVYPGVTEEVCGPILEKVSGLVFNHDFYLGYSPERIVPGDKTRTFKDILKITSGSTSAAASVVDDLYKSVVAAGTYKAENIKTAEAAKVIENTQRDVNIALINEFSIIFRKMGIDTNEVINAAATKWNFIELRPGLVGGHCIGVDPYYLIHESKQKGYVPDLIATARKINEQIPVDIVNNYLKLVGKNRGYANSKCLVIGATFKPNCNDLRNSKVKDIVEMLVDNGVCVDLFDDVADYGQLHNIYGNVAVKMLGEKNSYDGIILCVDHEFVFGKKIEFWRSLLTKNGVFFDIKSVYKKDESDFRL